MSISGWMDKDVSHTHTHTHTHTHAQEYYSAIKKIKSCHLQQHRWSLKWSESGSVVSHSLRPHGLCSPWNSPGQNTGVGSLSFLQGISQPRDQTQVSSIEGGFFTSWATGKPKNTGVGTLSLLQRIFLTQELIWGLLHCRWILYQLSYQGCPYQLCNND